MQIHVETEVTLSPLIPSMTKGIGMLAYHYTTRYVAMHDINPHGVWTPVLRTLQELIR